MKILVTGASGFIGRHCCAQLSALGYEVHAVSSKSQSDETVHWHKVDLLDSEQSIRLIHNIQPSHLLHLAWYAEPGKFWTSIENYNWVKASLTLFKEFAAIGGKRVVAAGTCAEYDWGYDSYVEEKTPLSPLTLYGVCKNSLHSMLSCYASQQGLSLVWGRVFSIYGPHDHPDRLVSSVIQGLIREEKIICSNADLIRDYLHVSDVAKAFVLLTTSQFEGVVNIGSGSGIKIREIVENIEVKIGHFGYLEILNNPIPSKLPRTLVSNNERLSSIGWTPTYDMESGLTHTINWFNEKIKS